jgi:ABC-type transporter Mla subunit MlaD
MTDGDASPFDRYETPFDESQGSIADLDAHLDPVRARLDRIDAITAQMNARLDQIEATLDRMDARLDKVVTKRQLRFWGIVLMLELTAWTLIVTYWR